jgi:polysaccharide chain length determinant protein (PEP-CTERM system associated)
MNQSSFEHILSMLMYEFNARRKAVATSFVLISLLFLFLGILWPKEYRSSVTIFVDKENIIGSLLEGNAVPTKIQDRARITKEILFSRKILDEVLRTGGWSKLFVDPIAIERKLDEVKKKTEIEAVGENLIRISFSDQSPDIAFRVVQKYTELFILESERSKRQESKAAYDFIDKQVEAYHKKLTQAEENLKNLREMNLDARPESEQEVMGRIAKLRSDLESASLALKEAEIEKESLKKQISGESEVNQTITVSGAMRQQIAEMQAQLDTLRLSYHDTYPDIVRLKHQIADLQSNMQNKRYSRLRVSDEEGLSVNPIYAELKSSLSRKTTDIETFTTRIVEIKKFVALEMDRLKRINDGETYLSELTRDYEVHRDIYQDLLKRRERARVSMNLDLENQGLNLKVQEPAQIPLTPKGVRFIHFAALGPLLGLLIPFGVIYVLLMFDGRIRHVQVLSEQYQLPILGVLPHVASSLEIQNKRASYLKLLSMFIAVLLVYAVAGWLRFKGIV